MNQTATDRNYQPLWVESCNYTGLRHLRSRQESEDTVRMTRTPEFCFYGIADGQSGKPGGKAGGAKSLQALENRLQEMGIAGILDYPFPDELPCLLMQTVRCALSGLVQRRGGCFSDYASTLLVLAMEPATGRYVLLHLGDGCALSIPKGAQPRILSAPENGFSGRETWLTTSANAVAHFRVTFGRVDAGSRLLLMSDGAEGLCRGRNISRQARELLCGGSPEQIRDFLKATEPEDDASCIILDFEA